ncbi:MAG: hypothetical protein Q9P90_00485 [candidate division KSB1 bacterium]|nr:hypothetical protein [candidate division KSB1 bacterium]
MRFAINGGGIGGLAMGVALALKGMDYAIYEAAEDIRQVGAGLWMASNALNVLEHLGIVEDIYQ